MLATLRAHWPEYLIEMGSLAVFMISAALFATLLQHPASPWQLATMPAFVARIPMGVAMGLTAMAIIYSPPGRRSGAHLNPAVTLTFFRLGKIAAVDAIGYVVAQFGGGVIGISAATQLLSGLPAHPSVNYVTTVPGPHGAAVAFVAEALISFGLMSTVLRLSNDPRLAGVTGVAAGLLVCLYITLEAPLSGMSMNPARSFGPALLAHTVDSLWVYFTAPLIGMLGAAEVYVRWYGPTAVRCAKLHHPKTGPCIFRCRAGSAAAAPSVVLPAINEVSA